MTHDMTLTLESRRPYIWVNHLYEGLSSPDNGKALYQGTESQYDFRVHRQCGRAAPVGWKVRHGGQLQAVDAPTPHHPPAPPLPALRQLRPEHRRTGLLPAAQPKQLCTQGPQHWGPRPWVPRPAILKGKVTPTSIHGSSLQVLHPLCLRKLKFNWNYCKVGWCMAIFGKVYIFPEWHFQETHSSRLLQPFFTHFFRFKICDGCCWSETVHLQK